MAVPTDQQILDSSRTALYEIVQNAAASYETVTGQKFTALDLDKLEKIISFYEKRVNRAAKGMFAGNVFRGPR